MMDSLSKDLVDELRSLLFRVREAKETLGMGVTDCAYKANKQLEPVASYLQFLTETLDTPTPAPATIKVVINRCYGGFGLSPRAEALFRRTEKVKPADEYFSVYEIPRDHPILIKIIEKLGNAAWGDHSVLRIVEVPDDVNWYIEEYDGMEHVAERHRVWK